MLSDCSCTRFGAVIAPGCSLLHGDALRELGLPSQLFPAVPEQRLIFSTGKHHRGSLFLLHALPQVCGISKTLITDVANTFLPRFCSSWVQKPPQQLQGSVFSLNSMATAVL